MKRLLIKLDRVAAWILLVGFFLYFLTGYGMTKGIMAFELARLLHNEVLPLPILLAFLIHGSYGVHISLKRWRVWNRRSLLILLSLVTLVGIFLILVELELLWFKPEIVEIPID